jgi:hypothetical protein
VGWTTGPLDTSQNGNNTFNITSATPTVLGASACPKAKWTATVTDVIFSNITLTLLEDGQLSDTFTF